MMGAGTFRAVEAVRDAGGRACGGWRRWVLAAAVAMATVGPGMRAGAAAARDEGPVRIPLEAMGYQTIAPEFLLSGSSMMTVNFVDNEHLLITFGLRRLMMRELDPPPDDDDRTIGAYLVELPSGKVLARAEWRLHDRLQYLWSLGHGRFLLRVRDRLTVIAPMQAGNADDPLREQPLLRLDRHIVAVLVSSNGDLLTVETTKRATGEGEVGEISLGDAHGQDPAPVQMNFYRLVSAGDDLAASPAGAIRTQNAVSLPLTAAGFLDVIEGGKGRWLFNFDEHAGKVDELAEWDTNCYPRPTFIGHSQFVAFGCHAAKDLRDLAGFNLKGEQMWQLSFYDNYVSPTFAFAPEGGRFALGRTIVAGDVDASFPLTASVVTAQEVRVYQSYDGRQLFRIDCSPIERAGQNFDLSGDGMRLAVVREALIHHAATRDDPAYTQRETAVEVYALPAPSDKDRAEVKAAEVRAPVDTGARIDLSLERVSVPAKAEGEAAVGATDAAAQAGTGSGAGDASAAVGDAVPEAPRKQPTLYGPGEGPEKKPQ